MKGDSRRSQIRAEAFYIGQTLDKSKKHEYDLNIKILYETFDKTDSVSRVREHLAIYRLYKKFDLSPDDIASILRPFATYQQHLHLVQWIRQRIGTTFAYMCLCDDTCVFKDFFSRTQVPNIAHQ